MNEHIEAHPLAPFLPQNAKMLMLGSFPPPKIRWNMDFYYPNFQNDMWRIFGLVFFQNKDYFVDLENKKFKQQQIEHFLQQKGIAIYDTATQVVRLKGNASDKFLQVMETTNILALLEKIPDCQHIMTTGDKATDMLMSVLPENIQKPSLGLSSYFNMADRTIYLHRMPSSSRAYPLALSDKAAQYTQFFQAIHML